MLSSEEGSVFLSDGGNMSDPLPRRTATFIVRLWAEYLDQTPPAWRGEIEHVSSGETMCFGDVNQMWEFIAGLTAKPEEGERRAYARGNVSERNGL
jgi:hypothetical protein